MVKSGRDLDSNSQVCLFKSLAGAKHAVIDAF